MTKTKTIVVSVPVGFSVSYRIKVKDVNDCEEIRETLLKGDASDWDSDPSFYEQLGSDFQSAIERMTDKQIREGSFEP